MSAAAWIVAVVTLIFEYVLYRRAKHDQKREAREQCKGWTTLFGSALGFAFGVLLIALLVRCRPAA